MNKPSDYFKKLDLAHLDANTAQFIREKVLTLPNIDILEGTKEFETIKAIVEENFPRAIGIEPIVELIPEPIIEAVVEPIIDTKQEEIKTISGQVSEMTDLIDLLSELVAENPSDLDSLDVLELYKENLVELADKLKALTEVITEAVTEVKDNIEEVKEVIKTDVVDTKGILTAPKKYKTEDGEEVLGYESDWNYGTKKHLGETVVYYVSNEENKNKYSVLSGILHKGEIVYSEDKTSNKEFENYSENVDDALKLAYELANDKDMVDKFENGGEIGDKFYYEQHGIGKAKYTVSYHDGVQKHKDGSPFYGIKIFKNKKDLNEFISKLNKEGYKYKNDSYTTKYVAVHESKDGYWTIASKPSSKEDAEAMLGGTPKNEVGKVVTLEEAKAHKKTLGEEYLYEKGGSLNNNEFNITKNQFQVRDDEPNRTYHWYDGTYKNYYFKAETDNSFKYGYGSDGINKGSVYKLDVWNSVPPNAESYFARYFNKWDSKPKTEKDKKAVREIVKYLDSISDKKDGISKYENGGEIDEIRSGAVVKWKGKEGAYHVSGTYEGTATLVPINPDPNRDYKGSYKVDVSDLELIQKSNTPKDHIAEYDKVLYKDVNGEYTKEGIVEKMYFQDGILLYKVKDAGSYTRDEIKKIK